MCEMFNDVQIYGLSKVAFNHMISCSYPKKCK
jgi:hypothetical protein